MRTVVARRIAQVFFLLLFLWFCVAATFGTQWWQLRGWPVNLLLELDPLVAVGTMLSTHTLYKGLLWALATVVATLVFGRVFCGWVCPFGTLHQFFGWLTQRTRKHKQKTGANMFRRAQVAKYFVLVTFLVMAAIPLGTGVSLQTGLLDPIPLMHRSVNLALLPVAEMLSGRHLSAVPRQYEGAWVVGGLFIAAILANFAIPRFYCRFLCPLGALLGVLSRYSVWRIAKTAPQCGGCTLCEAACEGACDPAGKIRISECVMCFNCLDDKCSKKFLAYRTRESDAGEILLPDMGRRGVVAALGASALAVPMIRLSGTLGSNHHPGLVRPPGSLPEAGFLERCIKCGQCMRVCPTNVIMPAGLNAGLEALWTPVLNFRIGTSGCELNCVACGHVCPTAAIRPITQDEKRGTGKYEDKGPIRIGAAFVDRGRCLPWAMDTPCIVCEENCPVTPKAIFVREVYNTVRDAEFDVAGVEGKQVQLAGRAMKPGEFATGDYYLVPAGSGSRARITANTADSVTVAGEIAAAGGEKVAVVARLQVPLVDVSLCIGCGVCEHECPVSGLRAIRVTAENETRNSMSSLRLERSTSR